MTLEPGETARFNIPIPPELKQEAEERGEWRTGSSEALGGGHYRQTLELWIDGELRYGIFVEYKVASWWATCWSRAMSALRAATGWRVRMFREEKQ